MSTIELERALAAGRSDVGPKVIALREDQWFDRKSIRVQGKDLANHLIAFANAEGGVLVLGVSDGSVEGLKRHAARLNDFQQASLDHTVPPVRAKVEQVGCVNDEGDVDTLVVIRVEASAVVHELKNGDCYLRVGTSPGSSGMSSVANLSTTRDSRSGTATRSTSASATSTRSCSPSIGMQRVQAGPSRSCSAREASSRGTSD